MIRTARGWFESKFAPTSVVHIVANATSSPIKLPRADHCATMLRRAVYRLHPTNSTHLLTDQIQGRRCPGHWSCPFFDFRWADHPERTTENHGTRYFGARKSAIRDGIQQEFLLSPGEALYGLGQHQEGFFDLRDIPVRLLQANTNIAIPFLLSTKGYGLLWNNAALTDFNPADETIELDRQRRRNFPNAARWRIRISSQRQLIATNFACQSMGSKSST